MITRPPRPLHPCFQEGCCWQRLSLLFTTRPLLPVLILHCLTARHSLALASLNTLESIPLRFVTTFLFLLSVEIPGASHASFVAHHVSWCHGEGVTSELLQGGVARQISHALV